MLFIWLLSKCLYSIYIALASQLVVLDVAIARFRFVGLNANGDKTVRIIGFFEALTNLRFKGIFVIDQVIGRGDKDVCFGIALLNLERRIGNTRCCISTKRF